MTLYYSRHEPCAVRAVQWTGANAEQLEELLGDVEMFFAAESAVSRRILIGEPDFPFWLERGEWLSRDPETGDLDGWADKVFRETFTLSTAEAAT